MIKKRALDTSFLDAVVPRQEESDDQDDQQRYSPMSRRQDAPKGAKSPKRPVPERERLTVVLDAALLEQIRDAAYYARRTLAGITEAGLRDQLKALERDFNGGKPFPRREEELRTGRPVHS